MNPQGRREQAIGKARRILPLMVLNLNQPLVWTEILSSECDADSIEESQTLSDKGSDLDDSVILGETHSE